MTHETYGAALLSAEIGMFAAIERKANLRHATSEQLERADLAIAVYKQEYDRLAAMVKEAA